jgi:uncharacterized protein YegL
MTDPNYRHYLLIVDRSGSMRAIREEATGGIRHFLQEQAALPGRATLTLVQFDNVHETVHDFALLEEAAPYELVPRGMTALLDACGFAVTGTGEKLAALPEQDRPGKVIVLITTDGEENHSSEYTKEQVRDMITRQQDDYGWQFSYVGANVDAFAEARALGIAKVSSLDFAGTPEGAKASYASASAASARYVRGQSASISYTDEERDKSMGK